MGRIIDLKVVYDRETDTVISLRHTVISLRHTVISLSGTVISLSGTVISLSGVTSISCSRDVDLMFA